MWEGFVNHLLACGRGGPARHMVIEGARYELRGVLKHDFFAATALYEIKGRSTKQKPGKIVLKTQRQRHFLGIPLSWLGRYLCCREVSILQRLGGLEGVPHLVCRYGRAGFVYEYIEGQSLEEQPELPYGFFDQLLDLLKQVHEHKVLYLDMNKRGNILVGFDRRPYLIDFQISLYIGEDSLLPRRLSQYLRQTLQAADLYHLYKHKRRLCPDRLRPDETSISLALSTPIRAHRMIATPLRKLRRAFLKSVLEKAAATDEKDDMTVGAK